MREKATATVKTTDIQKASSSSQSQRTERSEVPHSPTGQILFLQRTIGNRAVQRLFKSGVIRTKLKIGQPNDIYEQEADRVADQVMRMPEQEDDGRRLKGEERQSGGQWTADGGLKRKTLQLKPG